MSGIIISILYLYSVHLSLKEYLCVVSLLFIYEIHYFRTIEIEPDYYQNNRLFRTIEIEPDYYQNNRLFRTIEIKPDYYQILKNLWCHILSLTTTVQM